MADTGILHDIPLIVINKTGMAQRKVKNGGDQQKKSSPQRFGPRPHARYEAESKSHGPARTRTGTLVSKGQILSLLRLPFRHGAKRFMSAALRF